MKVTINDIYNLIFKLENNPIKLKLTLRTLFSYSYNIGVFGKWCFPEYIVGDVPIFHNEFYEILSKPSNDSFASPRGSAKSTTTGLVFISWCVVNQYEKYIVYVSQNHSKTVQFITPLRFEFSSNQRLKWLYEDIFAQTHKTSYDKDTEACIDVNGVRIEAVSFERNLRGFKYKNIRPTLIIGDDIESDERITNPVLRQKDEDKLNKVIKPSLDINGRFKMIGTILHYDSLLVKEINKTNGKVYKIEYNDGSLLWSARFTKEKLAQIKRDIGSVAYNQEYLNNPLDNSTSIIKRDWIEQCRIEEYYEPIGRRYLGVDFAFSDRIGADSTAIVDIIIDENNIKHIIDIEWHRGKSINEQIEIIKQKHKENDYDLIVFEENSIKSVSKDIRSFNLPIKMFWLGAKDTHTKQINSQKGKSISKNNAVNRLSVELENKMWQFPYYNEKTKKMINSLTEELTTWTFEGGTLTERGVHPDAPIGMILVSEAIRTSNTIDNIERKPKGTNVRTYEEVISKNIETNKIKELPTLF